MTLARRLPAAPGAAWTAAVPHRRTSAAPAPPQDVGQAIRGDNMLGAQQEQLQERWRIGGAQRVETTTRCYASG